MQNPSVPHRQNDPVSNEKRTRWESPLTGFVLPVLVGFLAFAGAFFVYQVDYHRKQGEPRTDYRDIPPELITYQETDVFPYLVAMGQATCFAIQNDSTFIIGTADPPALSFFDINGRLLRTMDLPEEPRAIACGTPETIFSDKIVVAHPQHIAIYSAEGEQEHSFRYPLNAANIVRKEEETERIITSQGRLLSDDEQACNIRSLVLTPDYLFIADTISRRIHRFDADSNRHTFGAAAESLGQELSWTEKVFDGFIVYASPIVMTFSHHDGLLYIANPGKHRVDVFTQEGIYQPELSWGEPSAHWSGFAGCCNPIGLAVLGDGRIVTVEKGISRVKIFKPDRSLDGVVAGPRTLEEQPTGAERVPLKPDRHFAAAVFSDGRIAIFDFEFATIRIFAPI
jgi:sugar lactone lactonase YvrE